MQEGEEHIASKGAAAGISPAEYLKRNGGDYAKALAPYAARFDDLRAKEVAKAGVFLTSEPSAKQLYFAMTSERSIRLIDGLLPMLESRNALCSWGLLRMQLDTCMRTYAPSIAADESCFFTAYAKDERIDKQKTSSGEKMTDKLLSEALGTIEPKFREVYESTSGAIHTSELLLAMAGEPVADKEYKVLFNIGCEPNRRLDPYLIECAEAFCSFTSLHLHLLDEVQEEAAKA